MQILMLYFPYWYLCKFINLFLQLCIILSKLKAEYMGIYPDNYTKQIKMIESTRQSANELCDHIRT